MQVGTAQIQRVDVDNFNIPIGSRVIIEPLGLGEKVKTHFIGMERKNYFIVSLAPFIGEEKPRYDFLYKGNRTKIFYTQDGVINGFIAKVMLYTTSPFRHIYFSYPTDAEICNLRQAQRTDCHLPCRIAMGDLELSGMMTNISVTGCAVSIRDPGEDACRAVAMQSMVGVRFYLLQNMREFVVPCEVKNKRLTGNMLTLGMCFENIDPLTGKRIAEFINWVLSFKA